MADRESLPQNLETLERLRRRGHSHCLACTHPEWKLEYELECESVLVSDIRLTESMTSFNGMVHGGLQALLIDEAMTCALMGAGVYAATCDLKIRYRHPVRAGAAQLQAWVESYHRGLCSVQAELKQGDQICTRASARFMKQVLE